MLRTFSNSAGAITARDRISVGSTQRSRFPKPSYISSILWEGWKNGCKILGASHAKLALVHYHGCFGLSAGEALFLKYIASIEKAGGPSIAIILPQSKDIIGSSLTKRLQQAKGLQAVVNGFPEEQKKRLPAFIAEPSVRDRLSGARQLVLQGSQQWHDILFTASHLPDLAATAPLLLAAGAEATGRARDMRRSMGIGHYIVSGFSLGVGMAAFDAFYREDEAPLGVLMAGAPLLRQVCAAKPVSPLRRLIHGVLEIYADDPIPQHALGHAFEDIVKVTKDYRLENLRIHREPGGHELNCHTMCRHFAALLNRSLKTGALACN